MVTHSVCGALPLAIFVTSDEKEQTLKDALEMLKTCLPDHAFYGAQFPKVVMTDNCYELHSSLSDVWPGAVFLLCLFHVCCSRSGDGCLKGKMASAWKIDLNCF